MAKPRISDADLCRSAKRIGTGTAEIKTFLAVETKNHGFDDQDRPVILFERHWFHKFTGGRFDAEYPDISNRIAGGYGSSASQYDRFSRAFALDPKAAMKSASWGLGQVMGFNFAIAGYDTVDDFVDGMKESEGKQLDASIEYIIHNDLQIPLRAHNWRAFAKGYNGPNYAENDYHNKLARYYKQFSSGKQIDCSKISAATTSPNPTGNDVEGNANNPLTPTPDNSPTDQTPPIDFQDTPSVETVTTEVSGEPPNTTATTTTTTETGTVNVTPVRPNIWTSVVAFFTMLYGYYKIARENFGDLVDRAQDAIDIHIILNIAIGAGLVVLGIWLHNRSRERAKDVTTALIATAADQKLNTVQLSPQKGWLRRVKEWIW